MRAALRDPAERVGVERRHHATPAHLAHADDRTDAQRDLCQRRSASPSTPSITMFDA
jgi:hypothetical protein